MEKKIDVILAAPAPVYHQQQQSYHEPAPSHHSYQSAPAHSYHVPAPSHHSYHSAPTAGKILLHNFCYCYHLTFIWNIIIIIIIVVAAPSGTLLGVKYSPSTSVSHMTYSAPLISYGMNWSLIYFYLNPLSFSLYSMVKGMAIRISGNTRFNQHCILWTKLIK